MAITAGQRFGKLVAIEFAGRGDDPYDRAARWKFHCDCGVTKIIRAVDAGAGVKSCGCLRRTAGGKSRSAEYTAWWNMKARCKVESTASNEKYHHNYAARGISICERWSDFNIFYADMGPRPTPRHSLDRIDNNGNYEPGNVRWATRKEQAANQRRVKLITFRGKQMPIKAAARLAGISVSAMVYRIKVGNALDTGYRGRRTSTPGKKRNKRR